MPTRRIRVLVVDDSAVVRRLVSEALSRDPEIEVVGTAIDPYVARDKILKLAPDVLTLDLEMPRMDGLTFLRILMTERPLPVIIMSSLTQQGSHQALEALRLGAVDVLAKPSGAYSFGDLGPQLLAKVKAAAVANLQKPDTSADRAGGRRAPLRPARPPSPPSPAPVAPPPRAIHTPPRCATASPFPASASSAQPFSIAGSRPPITGRAATTAARRLIVLGASTGGTEALRQVLTRLPAGLPPIAIVQHIPAVFSRTFAERLNGLCEFEVREAVDGEALVPGVALIAPGNYHLLVHWTCAGYRVTVTEGPQVWHQRPAVDLLFRSAAEAAGRHAIGGVLTGMGKDGAEGLLRLRESGATTFAQDEASSVVYGMPRVAWEIGAAQRQLSLDAMPDFIARAAADEPVAPPLPSPHVHA